jgi:hypothetical protein
MIGHVVPYFGPNGKQGALSLVVASVIFVGGAKVAGHDWPVYGRHNFPQSQVIWWSGQDVAATDAPLGRDNTGTLQGEQNLLQVGLGEASSLGDVTDRSGSGVLVVQGEA